MEANQLAVRAIILIDGKLLVGKRTGKIEFGKYNLIGGKVDKGEDPMSAVIREVYEETGLEFINPSLIAESIDDSVKPGIFCHTYYFSGEIYGKLNLELKELSEVRLVDRHSPEINDIVFVPDSILEKILNLLDQK